MIIQVKKINNYLKKYYRYERLTKFGARWRRKITNQPLNAKPNAGPKKAIAPAPARFAELYLEIVTGKKTINKKQILFESFWGRRTCCNPLGIFYILRSMEEFEDWEFVWVINKHTKIHPDVASCKQVRYVHFGHQEYVEALATSGILINNTNLPPYFMKNQGQHFVNTGHGIPLKTMGFDVPDTFTSIANTQRNLLIGDILLSNSKYTDDKLIYSYGVEGLVDHRILRGVFPRLATYNNNRTFASIFGFPKPNTKKIALYAPTWRGTRDERKGIDAHLAELELVRSQLPRDYELIVSLHTIVENTLNSNPNQFTFISKDTDINEVMAHTDLFIGDFSSAIFDYLYLDRKAVIITSNLDEYKEDRGIYLEIDELPVNQCSDLTTLNDVILSAKKPSEFPQYDKFAKSVLGVKRVSKKSFDPIKNIFRRIADLPVWENLEFDNGKKSKKKNILVAQNAFQNNGITTSLINLSNNIDYSKVNLFVIFGVDHVESSEEAFINCSKLAPEAKKILRLSPFVMDKEAAKIWKAYIGTNRAILDSEMRSLNFWFYAEVKRTLGDQEFDIAIDFAGYSSFWTKLVSHVKCDKRIALQHSELYSEFKNPKKDQKKLVRVFETYKDLDYIIAVSQELANKNLEDLREYLPHENAVSFLNNTVWKENIERLADSNIDFIYPEKSALIKASNNYRFIFIGRLSPEKRVDRLLNAMAKVVKKVPSATLLIIGDGSQKLRLEAIAKSLRITNNVKFLGHLENPYVFLKHSDCLVLSSDYEGQSMTLLEALTMGKLCIGTDIPGNRSVLSNDFGVLCEKSVEGLSAAMHKAATTKQKKKKFNVAKYNKGILDKLYFEIGEF